jgi:hypothetical protein
MVAFLPNYLGSNLNNVVSAVQLFVSFFLLVYLFVGDLLLIGYG